MSSPARRAMADHQPPTIQSTVLVGRSQPAQRKTPTDLRSGSMYHQPAVPDEWLHANAETQGDYGPTDLCSRSSMDGNESFQWPSLPDQYHRRLLPADAPTSRHRHAWMVAHTNALLDQPENEHARDAASVRDHPGKNNNDVERYPYHTGSALDGATTGESQSRAGLGSFPLAVGDEPSIPSHVHQSHAFPAYQGLNSPYQSEQAAHRSIHDYGYTWSHKSNQYDDGSISSTMGKLSANEEEYYGSNDNDSDDREEAKEEDGDEETSCVLSTKTSRYLREMDRRVILERLARGEKQSTLAKEFNVSRAAICNLFKHRNEVMARADENPYAKHPKKKKKAKALMPPHDKRHRAQGESKDRSQSIIRSNVGTTTVRCSSHTALPTAPCDGGLRLDRLPVGTLHVIKSVALAPLLSATTDRARSLTDFRRNSERVFWLILEEALALVPVREVLCELQETGHVDVQYEVESPPCALTMEMQTANATPMLDIFQLIQPQQPCGIVTVATHRDALTVEISGEEGDRLPSSLRAYNVFLLDVVAASGEIVCAAIEKLLGGFGVLEANVSIVALFTSSEVVAMVQCKYPLVKIVTARIDSSITRRRIASTPVDLVVHRVRTVYGAPGAARIGPRP